MTSPFTSEQLDILRRARERISDPARWTQGWFARNAAGNKTTSVSADACRWCAAGALVVEGREDGWVLLRAIQCCLQESLFVINDRQGHADVLAAFDKLLTEPAVSP